MDARPVDARPAGVFPYSMRSPDGHVLCGTFVYRDIKPPERIVSVNRCADEAGNTIRVPFSPTWPLEILNTVTVAEPAGKTTVTFRSGPIDATAEERATFWNARDSVRQGFAGTFDQLAASRRARSGCRESKSALSAGQQPRWSGLCSAHTAIMSTIGRELQHTVRLSPIMQRSVAEALGTFILVFVGSGTATAVTLLARPGPTVPAVNVLVIGLGLGLALFIGIMVVGKVSGGHFNPAVTIGLAAVRRFDWANAPGYLIGQFVGAILGAIGIVFVFNASGARNAGLGAPTLAPGMSIWQGLLIEALGTAILVLTIMGTAVDTRAVAGWAPLAIGLTLAAIILFIGPATGGSVNPARAFGPDIVAVFFGFPVDWAAFVVSYLIGPLLGGAAAAFVYTAIAGLPHPSVTAQVGGPRPQAAEVANPDELRAPGSLPTQ